jgi:hypothetical protein
LGNAQLHAQVALLFSVSIRTLRADLWCIRGTIHLENDGSWFNPPPSEWLERTRPKGKSVPNQLTLPWETSLFTKICQTPEGYAVWDIHPVMALQVDQESKRISS